MSKIGIMGGTFNPIHKGHIQIAKHAYQQFSLDEVWFVPNNIPAYKTEDGIVSGSERLHMVSLAIAPYSYFKLSDIELLRDGNTYTIDTLKQLCAMYDEHEFYFIMGEDSLVSFHKWVNYKEIPSYAKILVAPRQMKHTNTLNELIKQYNLVFGDNTFSCIDCEWIPCSSSLLRKNICKYLRDCDLDSKKVITMHLEQKVWQFIYENKLYLSV